MSLLAQIVLAVAILTGGIAGGWKLRADYDKARDFDIAQVRQQTKDDAAEGTANVLSKLQPIHQRIIQEATHEIRTNPIFIDCKSGPDLVRNYNAIVSGQSPSSVHSELPGVAASSPE